MPVGYTVFRPHIFLFRSRRAISRGSRTKTLPFCTFKARRSLKRICCSICPARNRYVRLILLTTLVLITLRITVLEIEIVWEIPHLQQFGTDDACTQNVLMERRSRQGVSATVEIFIWCFLSQPLYSALRSAMARDAHTVAGWDFDRIIPCHGVSFLNPTIRAELLTFL